MATDNPATKHPGESGECMVNSLEETFSLAARLLPLLKATPAVSLEGPLGAGKTHFVKAIARAMGISDDVTSPTFTLLQSYGRGENRLHHSDWYRLDSESEVLALGLDEFLGDGVMLIEWGDKFSGILPEGTLRIRIEPGFEGTREVRRITWYRTEGL
jgi:tRNA threonylcarbamoyladenosine biosynthesis protein TsaE